MRDYRRWLLHEGPTQRSVVYTNSALTAIDDFYTRLGLGKATIDHDELPATAPARWTSRPGSAGCAPSRRTCPPGTARSR